MITVCTPTFNRATQLERLHRGLLTQTFRDFEWLVIDDGSTDETETVIAELSRASHFPVRYVYKANGGKHTALNVGSELAKGYFCAVLDSDDWYLPHCLERLRAAWDSIPRPDEFAEVQGLCETADGTLVGDPFPRPVFDSDYYSMTEVYRLRGDRKGMFRTEVLRAYPFPEQFGAVLVPEAIVWNRMSKCFSVRGINEVVARNEYLETGLTRRDSQQHIALSGPRLLYLEELLKMAEQRPMPPRRRFKAYANLVRNGIHQRRPLLAQLRHAPSRAWWIAGFPAGIALSARDRLRGR